MWCPSSQRHSNFNPRSHERSDKGVAAAAMTGVQFQSTLPREERQLLQLCTKQLFSISIHAPKRGATAMFVGNNEFGIFQSTLPREERHNCLSFKILLPLFQSTLPREERQQRTEKRYITPIFQSTLPREERPCQELQIDDLKSISIHAPTRGATLINYLLKNRLAFQSTLPREERQRNRQRER